MKLLKAAAWWPLAALCLLVAMPATAADKIQNPSTKVPQVGLAYGAVGQDATGVTAATPLPTTDATTQAAFDDLEAQIDALQEAVDDLVASNAEIATNTGTAIGTLPPTAPAAKGDATFSSGTISLTSSGDNTLVSATSDQTTRVHYMAFTVRGHAADVRLTFKSGSTTLGYRDCDADAVECVFSDWPPWAYAYFATGTNEAFIVNLSVNAVVAGDLRYVKN